MEPVQVGAVRIDAVIENARVALPFSHILPDLAPALLTAEREWLEPLTADLARGEAVLAFHSYLVRTPKHTILVDTCIGNDKERGGFEAFHRLNTPYLANLHDCGVAPEAIDFVMCTHMHADHVGWNTRLRNGRWVATFPKAKYLFAREEFNHRRDHLSDPNSMTTIVYNDSVLPVVESGQAVIVDSDHDIDGTVTLEAAPGHTPGTVLIHLQSRGETAVLTGDIAHHPIQIMYPEQSSAFCEDRVRSATTRTSLVKRFADTATLLLPAHFPAPTAGYIRSRGARWRFDFVS